VYTRPIWLSLLGFTHWADSAVRVTVFRDLASWLIHLNTMLYRSTEVVVVDCLSNLSHPLNPLRLTKYLLLGYTVEPLIMHTLNEGHLSIVSIMVLITLCYTPQDNFLMVPACIMYTFRGSTVYSKLQGLCQRMLVRIIKLTLAPWVYVRSAMQSALYKCSCQLPHTHLADVRSLHPHYPVHRTLLSG
jgi:hypothetical protein